MKLLLKHEFNQLSPSLGKPSLNLFGTKRGFYLTWSDAGVINYRAFCKAVAGYLSPDVIHEWIRSQQEAGHCLKRSTVGCGAVGSATLYTKTRSVAEDLFGLVGDKLTLAAKETAGISNACFRRMDTEQRCAS